jgi:DNA-binding transcriptional LysR family regulator
MPLNHPLAGQQSISASQIDGMKFIHFDSQLAIRRAIDRALRAKGIDVNSVLTFDNVENIKQAVEVGAGIAILPAPSLAREIASGVLIARPLSDIELNRPLAVIHRGSSSLSLSATRLLAELTSTPKANSSPSSTFQPVVSTTL